MAVLLYSPLRRYGWLLLASLLGFALAAQAFGQAFGALFAD